MELTPLPLCRVCREPLRHQLVDLGLSPLANSYVTAARLGAPEAFYPLCVFVCPACLLVQLEAFESPEHIFSEYLYFSSYSESWLSHARRYAGDMQERYGLGAQSRVIEVASNDGYLLQYFQAQGIPVLGIEPAANVAAVAEAKGIPTLTRFMGLALADELADRDLRADLLVANNVLAHVPDLRDFVAGLARLLKPQGVLTIECPHLLELMAQSQFDTIYHEHFSYFSLLSAEAVLKAHGLEVFDVELLATHGGSLRMHVQLTASGRQPRCSGVAELRAREQAAGLDRVETYAGFQSQVQAIRDGIWDFLREVRSRGQTLAAYGAPAKGNTFLNYCGLRREEIPFTVDRSPHKQGTYLPGSRIPVLAPEALERDRPDYLLILPWNLKQEIMAQLSGLHQAGTRFVTAIPRLELL